MKPGGASMENQNWTGTQDTRGSNRFMATQAGLATSGCGSRNGEVRLRTACLFVSRKNCGRRAALIFGDVLGQLDADGGDTLGFLNGVAVFPGPIAKEFRPGGIGGGDFIVAVGDHFFNHAQPFFIGGRERSPGGEDVQGQECHDGEEQCFFHN